MTRARFALYWIFYLMGLRTVDWCETTLDVDFMLKCGCVIMCFYKNSYTNKVSLFQNSADQLLKSKW